MFVEDIKARLGVRQEGGVAVETTGDGAVQSVDSWKISQLECGSYHCMALMASGAVWSWGSNEFGQMAIGEHEEEVGSSAEQGTTLLSLWWKRGAQEL